MNSGLSYFRMLRLPVPHRSRWAWKVVMSGAAWPAISRSLMASDRHPLAFIRRPVCRSSVIVSVAIRPTSWMARRRNMAADPAKIGHPQWFRPGWMT
jgi:hypothetical protein